MAILMQIPQDLAIFDMIFDSKKIADNIREYFLDSATLRRILALRCDECDNGRVEHKVFLDGEITAIEQSYVLSDNGIFESHKKFVDFQFIAKGSEIMKIGFMEHFVPLDRYNEANDVLNYTAIESPSMLSLYENNLLILSPRDIHSGGFRLDSNIVFKSVLKVPLCLLKIPL